MKCVRQWGALVLLLFPSAGGTAITVDSFASVQAALNYAVVPGNGVDGVLFSPTREYRLGAPSSGSPDTHALHMQGASDLVIDGQGARIIVTDPALGLLYMSHSTNISVRGLEITYDPLPNAQGTIVAVDQPSASITVELQRNDSLAPPIFASASIRWALIKERAYPRRQKPGPSFD